MSSQNSIKEKRWELLAGVKKGLDDLFKSDQGVDKEEVKRLIDDSNELATIKEKVVAQEDKLKLSLLIASRERNVYLEKLRKIEEFCDDKNWTDDENLMKEIYDILYNDNSDN